MKVAIKDANIIFDFYEMDLLETCLGLDFDFITSDFVNSEIKTETIKLIINEYKLKKLISIESLDAEQLTEAFQINLEQPGLSIPDCSVIILAQKHNAIILSGDKALRNKAKQSGIEYHGILWILDTLIEYNRISKDTAFTKLKELMKTNKRLPVSKCNKRFENWSNK